MTLATKHFFLSLILLTGAASAQVETGTPQFGSFGGGPFDTINLGNLNVHFAVPVLHKAGRGCRSRMISATIVPFGLKAYPME